MKSVKIFYLIFWNMSDETNTQTGDDNTAPTGDDPTQAGAQGDDDQKPVVPIGTFGKDDSFAAKVTIPAHTWTSTDNA